MSGKLLVCFMCIPTQLTDDCLTHCKNKSLVRFQMQIYTTHSCLTQPLPEQVIGQVSYADLHNSQLSDSTTARTSHWLGFICIPTQLTVVCQTVSTTGRTSHWLGFICKPAQLTVVCLNHCQNKSLVKFHMQTCTTHSCLS